MKQQYIQVIKEQYDRGITVSDISGCRKDPNRGNYKYLSDAKFFQIDKTFISIDFDFVSSKNLYIVTLKSKNNSYRNESYIQANLSPEDKDLLISSIYDILRDDLISMQDNIDKIKEEMIDLDSKLENLNALIKGKETE